MFKFERIDAAAVILQISTHALIRPDGQDTTHSHFPLCSFNHVSILLRPLCVQYRFMMMRSSEEYAAVR